MFKKKPLTSRIALLLISTLILPVQLMAGTAPKTITIVHTNDTHSRIEEGSVYTSEKVANTLLVPSK